MGGGGSGFGVAAGGGQSYGYGNDLSRLFGPIAGQPIAASNNQPAMMGQPNVQSMFPLKKPGVPWDPTTDWYGYPSGSINAQNQFPPPSLQGGGGQGYRVL